MVDDGQGALAEQPGSDDDGSTDRADALAVYASARLVDTTSPVGAIRFDPEDAGRPLGDGRTLSGWSVFTGEETDEELTDADRVRLPSLAWVVRRDPAVAMVTAGHDDGVGYWARGEDDERGLPTWERVLP